MTFEDTELTEAIMRIARTPDGRKFHLALQRSLMALAPSPESGALQTFEGGRRFAAKLKEVMDKGLATNDGPEHERPIVILAKPVDLGRRRGGAGRRVSADDTDGR